jgi:hypothetical protein
MKSKIIVIIICAVLFTAVFVLELFREVFERARDVQINDVIPKLAVEIKYFQIQEGHYPHSLSELQSTDFSDEADKKIIQELIGITQHNGWHDTYDYIPSTNGFTIVVTGTEPAPAGWFGKQHRIEKHYKIGEDVMKQ